MQKSGLTEIIPLICTSAIWSQDPVFSHHHFPQVSLWGVAASDSCEMSGTLSFLNSLRAHQLTKMVAAIADDVTSFVY